MTESPSIAKLKYAAEIALEARQIVKSIRSMQAGSATKIIVQQTIDLLERQRSFAIENNDAAWAATACDVIEPLRAALSFGLDRLRAKAPPGPEIIMVEQPIVNARIQVGHQIQRQVRCVGGIIDLVDMTAGELIECKAAGDASSIAAAGSQLRRYGPHFSPSFYLTIAVPNIQLSARWLVDLMSNEGFRFIEVESGNLL
jgi:hypothetical protein